MKTVSVKAASLLAAFVIALMACGLPPSDVGPVDLARASYEHTSLSVLPEETP